MKGKHIQSQTMKYFVQRSCTVITPHLASNSLHN